jgi:hypothetical protein
LDQNRSVTIGPDGRPQKLTLLQSADSSLDAQAVKRATTVEIQAGLSGRPTGGLRGDHPNFLSV